MNANKRIIPVSALLVGATITLAELQRHNRLPGADQWIGVVLAYFIMSALSDLGLPIAGGFAVLLMVGVLLSRGDDALAFVSGQQAAAGKRSAQQLRRRPRGASRAQPAQGGTMPAVEPMQPAEPQQSPSIV